MEAHDITAQEVADDLGVNAQRLKDIFRGKTRFPTDLVVEIPKAYDLRTEWWLHGAGEMFHPGSGGKRPTRRHVKRLIDERDQKEATGDGREILASTDGREFLLLPRYDVRVSAGGGSIIHSEQIVDYLAFNRIWYEREIGIPSGQVMLFEVHGDSMVPDLQDRELVFVHTAINSVASNGIYVLLHGEHLLIKKVSVRMDGKIEIKSSNESYGVETLTPEQAEQLVVVGRAKRAIPPIRRLP